MLFLSQGGTRGADENPNERSTTMNDATNALTARQLDADARTQADIIIDEFRINPDFFKLALGSSERGFRAASSRRGAESVAMNFLDRLEAGSARLDHIGTGDKLRIAKRVARMEARSGTDAKRAFWARVGEAADELAR